MADREQPGTASPVGWPQLRGLAAGGELAALLDTRPVSTLDPGELVDLITAAKRVQTYFEALGLTAADELRRRMAADDPATEADPGADPTRYAAIEVAAATAETKHRASCRLHQVRRLSTELPRVWELVRRGRLDLYSADQILGELSAVVDRSLLPALEAEIVGGLLCSTPSGPARADGFGLVGINPTRTRSLARRAVAAAQPGHTDERHKRAFSERRLVAEHDGDGMGSLWLSHSVDRIAGISHRLGLIARSLPADDARTMDQRVADLAADILEGRISVDTCTSLLEAGAPAGIRGTALRRRIQINVTVPIQTLMGMSDMPGEDLDGAVVPASLARQLAADPGSVWYRMLTDGGRFVELSTHVYTPTADLRRTITARDRTCFGVGCNHPADRCDADHTLAHGNGGETVESNLGAGCRVHHNAKDGGPFTLVQPRPGVFGWTYPSGHTYTTTADRYPEADWPPEPPIPGASPVDIRAGLSAPRCQATTRRRPAAVARHPARDRTQGRPMACRHRLPRRGPRPAATARPRPTRSAPGRRLPRGPVDVLDSWVA